MFFKKQDAKDALLGIKTLKIDGIKFKIKKINILDYLEGFKVLFSAYETYKHNPNAKPEDTFKAAEKAKKIYRDILLAGVVSPKISAKEQDDAVQVDELFNNWPLVEKIVTGIVNHTMGKKKIK